jgi:hypothetical protein
MQLHKYSAAPARSAEGNAPVIAAIAQMTSLNPIGTLKRVWKAVAAWQAGRDERLWREFEDAKVVSLSLGVRLGQVDSIRQNARSGTKGYMRWIDTGSRGAVWLQGGRLRRGDVMVVAGFEGHGDHHNEAVFHIKSVKKVLPARTYRAWRRHETRRMRPQHGAV